MALIPGLTPVTWTPYGACHLLISPEATPLTVMLPSDPGSMPGLCLKPPLPGSTCRLKAKVLGQAYKAAQI